MREETKMKHVFIMNDIKKNHDLETSIKQIMNGYDYHIQYTHSPQEIKNYIKSLKEPTRIYAVGGDGAIHHVTQSLVHSEHELVVIPYGTGNDFSRTITVDKDPLTILKKSLQAISQKIDVIQVNDDYCINATCFGLDSIIANHVHDIVQIPFVPESKSYIVSILQNVMQFHPQNILIESQGNMLYQGSSILCTVNNAKYYGGGFCIVPHADIQDGYMDICVVEGVSKRKYPGLIRCLLKHTLHTRKEVHFYHVKEARVKYIQTCNIDGEEKHAEECDMKVIPQSLNLVKIEN